jgi:hypothetical protein
MEIRRQAGAAYGSTIAFIAEATCVSVELFMTDAFEPDQGWFVGHPYTGHFRFGGQQAQAP